jgi:hypothetical protein
VYNGPKNTPFHIKITEKVVFRDRTGTVLQTYEVGDIVQATKDTGTYFVTTMGGIYHHEAQLIGEHAK